VRGLYLMQYSEETKGILLRIIKKGSCYKDYDCKEHYITINIYNKPTMYDVVCPLLGRSCRMIYTLSFERRIYRPENYRQIAVELFNSMYGEGELFDELL
jgi:hypothetical protein